MAAINIYTVALEDGRLFEELPLKTARKYCRWMGGGIIWRKEWRDWHVDGGEEYYAVEGGGGGGIR